MLVSSRTKQRAPVLGSRQRIRDDLKLNLSTFVQSSLELRSLVKWELLITYKQRRDWPSKLRDLNEAANTSNLNYALNLAMSSEGGPPLSLRPFPVADQKPKNLAEFIARVNAQPGGFRSITEEKLREELRNSEDPDAADDQDEELSEAAGEADVAERDPGVARMEVLKNIEYGCSYTI